MGDPILNTLTSARKAPAGNAVLPLFTVPATNREMILLRNESLTLSVYIKVQLAGSDAPSTTTVLDTPFVLRPGELRAIDVNEKHDVYAMNSGGGAGTSNLYVEEIQGGAFNHSSGGGGLGATEAKQDTQITHLSEIEGAVETLEAAVSTDSVRVLRKLRFVTCDLTIPVSSTGDGTTISGDLVVDSTIVNSVVRANDAGGLLVGVQISDEANLQDAAAAYTLYLVRGNHDWGTINSAVGLSITNSRDILGRIDIAVADWIVVRTGSSGMSIVEKVAGDVGMPKPIRPVSGTDDLYLVLVARDTVVLTAGFWRVTLCFEDFA